MIQFADNPAMRAAAVYIALLVLGVVPLAIRVVRIGIGDGGNRALAQAIRVFANYEEYAPFGLALLLALPLAASRNGACTASTFAASSAGWRMPSG